MKCSPIRRWLIRRWETVALVILGLAAAIQAAEPAVLPKQAYGGKRTDFTLPAGAGFIIEPSVPGARGERPWIWYAPTINRYPNQALRWLMAGVLAHGFYICGIDVGETFANPAARTAFDDFYHFLVRNYGLDPKACLLAQSRGGLNLYHFAAQFPERVRCIAGIYPVGDLRSYPGLKRAASAYGMTPDQLEAELSRHNPIDLLAPIARSDIPILHLHGDADKIVPLQANSQVIYDRYHTLGGRMRLIVVPGHGHEEIPAFFESEELLQFLLAQGANLPPAVAGAGEGKTTPRKSP